MIAMMMMCKAPLWLYTCIFLTTAVAGDKCLPSNTSCWPTSDEWESLSASLSGPLLFPTFMNRAVWNDAIKLKNRRLSITPACVFMAQVVEDVELTVRFAASHNLLFSVKSTGHCYSGNCMAQDSLHLDVSGLNSIVEDDATNTVILGPGANFGEAA